MGGSSSVNGMIFVRGNRADFDAWADEGNKGWAYEGVLPTYKRSRTSRAARATIAAPAAR